MGWVSGRVQNSEYLAEKEQTAPSNSLKIG
jgi:hypothetical protein